MVHPVERIHPRNLKLLAEDLSRLIETRLWAQILLGMALGILVGTLLGPSVGWLSPSVSTTVGQWLALPGNIFLTAIQMIVLPLIVASVIRGVASSGDPDQLKKSGIGLAAYFILTTIAATIIGIGFAYLIRPGSYVDPELMRSLAGGAVVADVEPLGEGDGIAGLPGEIVKLLPRNPLSAMVKGEMLQVVIFSIVLGVALISIEPESSKPLFDLMGSIQRVSMKIVAFIMPLAPLAVFGLLAQAMIETGAGVLMGLGVYAASVVGALFVLMLVYLAIVSTLGKKNPREFMVAIREAQLLAFSTDSSAATMPVTIKAAEEGLHVRPSISQLVIPMGATVNMGGTACYHGLATIFIAQLFGMDLPPSALLALILTSLASSLGAPATPGVGIMILATVLNGAGVPLAGLSLIIGLDQVLERVRCVMNVTGDLVAAVVMDRFVGGKVSRREEVRREEALEIVRETEAQDVVVTSNPGS